MANLMSLGTRALLASQAQLQTTSHNIANANTEGYSRQQVHLQASPGIFGGAGFFGRGVDVEGVSRTHDAFLTREAAAARSVAEMDATRLSQLKRLEEVFPLGEAGIGHAAGQLFNALSDLASRPGDASSRQVVLARTGELAARFATANDHLDALQAGVNTDLRTAVQSVNGLAANIAQLNQDIARLNGLGQEPNDLLDRRDQLIHELSGFVQLSTVPAEDGTVGVFIAGGQRLVLGNQAQQLQVQPDTMDGARAAIAIRDPQGPRILDTRLLGSGGSVVGLLRFQNDDLASARNELGRMAAAVGARLNEQQSYGLDLRNPPRPGGALLAWGGPVAQPAATNARSAAGDPLAGVAMQVTDASLLEAAEYELRADPASAGRYLMTRSTDGAVFRTDGTAFTRVNPLPGQEPAFDPGFTFSLRGAPAAGDRFLLQPVARAAAGMQRVLDDPRGLAAASPLTASAGATNAGTAAVGALRVTSTALNPALTARIGFTDAAGGYDWSLTDAAGTVVSSGSGTWQGGEPLALNGFELSFTGAPSRGDSFTVAPTPFAASNNGNALALAALRDETFIGRELRAGQVVGGESVTDAYAGVMAGVGVRVQSASAASEISQGVASATLAQRDERQGVNLDEEAARLIQYQQSYQAAAKVLQVAQSVFDTLLSVAGR